MSWLGPLPMSKTLDAVSTPKIEFQGKKLCLNGGSKCGGAENELYDLYVDVFHMFIVFYNNRSLDSRIAHLNSHHSTSLRFGRMYFSHIRSHVGKGGRFWAQLHHRWRVELLTFHSRGYWLLTVMQEVLESNGEKEGRDDFHILYVCYIDDWLLSFYYEFMLLFWLHHSLLVPWKSENNPSNWAWDGVSSSATTSNNRDDDEDADDTDTSRQANRQTGKQANRQRDRMKHDLFNTWFNKKVRIERLWSKSQVSCFFCKFRLHNM